MKILTLVFKFIVIVFLVFIAGCSQDKSERATAAVTPAPCAVAVAPTFSTVQNLFSTNCDYCHSHSFHNYTTAAGSANSIYAHVDNRSMPQGASLNTADLQAIESWISCGTKQ